MADNDKIYISSTTSNPLLDFAELKSICLPTPDINGYFPAISDLITESVDKKIDALAQHVDELEQDISFFNDRREHTDDEISFLFQKHNDLKVAVDVLKTEVSQLRNLYSNIDIRLKYIEENKGDKEE